LIQRIPCNTFKFSKKAGGRCDVDDDDNDDIGAVLWECLSLHGLPLAIGFSSRTSSPGNDEDDDDDNDDNIVIILTPYFWDDMEDVLLSNNNNGQSKLGRQINNAQFDRVASQQKMYS
jgi:hypothetical protein